MKGYIIYFPEEAKKNDWFIETFQKSGEKRDMDIEYVSVEEYEEKPLPDFVINRTRKEKVSGYYEQKDIPVFHSSLLTKISNDKYLTLQYLTSKLPTDFKNNNKWAPHTDFLPPCSSETEFIHRRKKVADYLENHESAVIKSVDGHGGTEVFLLTKDGDTKIPEELEQKPCILQEKVDCGGKDLRVYVLGGKIYQAVLREGDNDFRANYSLGGSVSAYTLTESQKEMISKFINAFPKNVLGMMGLDFFVMKDGTLLFNELEEMVGSRMLYKCYDCNIVDDYVEWLHQCLLEQLSSK